MCSGGNKGVLAAGHDEGTVGAPGQGVEGEGGGGEWVNFVRGHLAVLAARHQQRAVGAPGQGVHPRGGEAGRQGRGCAQQATGRSWPPDISSEPSGLQARASTLECKGGYGRRWQGMGSCTPGERTSRQRAYLYGAKDYMSWVASAFIHPRKLRPCHGGVMWGRWEA